MVMTRRGKVTSCMTIHYFSDYVYLYHLLLPQELLEKIILTCQRTVSYLVARDSPWDLCISSWRTRTI